MNNNTASGLERNANGTYTDYISALSSAYSFRTQGSGFNGSIDNVSVIEITDDTDLPRINYKDGEGSLLLEPQRTNLLPNSTNFSGSNWFNFQSATTLNQYNSLTNLNNATLFYPTVSSAYASLYDTTNTTNGIFTRSVFAKANGKDFLCIDDTVGGLNWFNLSNGTLGTINSNYDAEIISYGGGWYRCSVTNKSAATYNYLVVYLVTNADNSTTITANGTDGILLFGGQTEQGSYPTSYIPTNGSTVTRLADVCNNSGNSDLINSTEGVLYAEISALNNGGTHRILSLSDKTNNNLMFIRFDVTPNRIVCFSRGSGGSYNVLTTSGVDQTNNNKIALVWDNTNVRVWINGSQTITQTINNLPINMSTLSFTNPTGSETFYGNVKCVAVFKEALSDTELQKLTTI